MSAHEVQSAIGWVRHEVDEGFFAHASIPVRFGKPAMARSWSSEMIGDRSIEIAGQARNDASGQTARRRSQRELVNERLESTKFVHPSMFLVLRWAGAVLRCTAELLR
jgi:hypothetical protein